MAPGVPQCYPGRGRGREGAGERAMERGRARARTSTFAFSRAKRRRQSKDRALGTLRDLAWKMAAESGDTRFSAVCPHFFTVCLPLLRRRSRRRCVDGRAAARPEPGTALDGLPDEPTHALLRRSLKIPRRCTPDLPFPSAAYLRMLDRSFRGQLRSLGASVALFRWPRGPHRRSSGMPL